MAIMRILLMIYLLGFGQPDHPEADVFGYDALTAMIEQPTAQTCLIDLRSEKDFGLAHLEGFVSQPWENGEEQLLMLAGEYQEDTTFYFLCYSGMKSDMAQELFEENGYHAVSIPFGFDEYVAECGNYYAHGATICEPCKEDKP